MPKIINPNLNPSPELSYILGVIEGDGFINTNYHGSKYPFTTYDVGLKVISETFANEFSRNLKLIDLHSSVYKAKPSRTSWSSKPIFVVRATSVVFYKWFDALTLSEIESKYLVTDEQKRQFIKGFYESEGNIKPVERWSKDGWYLQLRIFNSDKEVLELVNRLLLSLGYHFNLTKDSDKIGAKYTSNWYGNLNNGKQEEVWRFLKFINPSTKRIEDYDWRDKIK